jgi:uncharacterized protein
MDRIDVFTVARNRADWSGRLPLAAMPRLCASLTDGPGDRDGMLAYRCRGAMDAHGRPALALWLQAVLPLRCDRCGNKLALALDAERSFYFVATQAELAAIPIDDSPDEALLGSPQFDLAALIEDEAILQLPISPRHADCEAAPRAASGAAAAPAHPADAGGRPHPFAGLAALRGQLQGPAEPEGAPASERLPRKGRPKAS